VWRWDQQEAFGNNPADEDPDANSVAFDPPLRLPGQRYDKESGLHYNYFRDYDPSIGRYAESDPIGLFGGVNIYLYVRADPISYFDPSGLDRREKKHVVRFIKSTGKAGSSFSGSVALDGLIVTYVIVPDCFILVDTETRRTPGPAIPKARVFPGSEVSVTQIQYVTTTYYWGPPKDAPCCKGSERFDGRDDLDSGDPRLLLRPEFWIFNYLNQ
jgi:RHS repeat-associated protein